MDERIKINEHRERSWRDEANYQEYVDPGKTDEIEREKDEQRQPEQQKEHQRPKQNTGC